jgi:heme/copper-type cytochrome/quinol oxidase subunit 2
MNRERRARAHMTSLVAAVFTLLCSAGPVVAAGKPSEAALFTFVQLSDIHWGFENPAVNPKADSTLMKTIKLINNLSVQPDFIVATGDLTHTTDNPTERSRRMAGLKNALGSLKVKDVRYLPGEHDAAMDSGAAYKEHFGPTRYTFEHKGIHFIALDNVSDPTGGLGDEQLKWLGDELARLNPDTSRIVVLTHRPLFDLYPQWDWATRDGDRARGLLARFKKVLVLYGHIHQVHEDVLGTARHLAARGLMYPLPAPGSVPKKAPVAWDSMQPYRGLGYRLITARFDAPEYIITEYAADEPVRVIPVTARQFEFEPKEIHLKKGVPAILELTSLDRLHGFVSPGLSVRADVKPGEISRIRLTPMKAGQFEFHCDIFCGEGHTDMAGKIIVSD